jgi:hypothetical protein
MDERVAILVRMLPRHPVARKKVHLSAANSGMWHRICVVLSEA